LPGASPAEVEAQVSQPIEEVVNTVPGIKELRSISGMGSSFIIVTFDLGRDIESAAQDVRDRVATVLRDLPRDVDPPIVSKLDNDQSPILSIALVGNRSARELTELADKVVKVQEWNAPSACGWMQIGSRPTRFPSPPCATRL
jgi:HAE1 family hydrophobic/amphiphilic exporter-1